jgi:hypothetical protein
MTTAELSEQGQQLIDREIRCFLGDDTGTPVFSSSAIREFVSMARVRHPGASDSRISAIAAVFIADSRGFYDLAEGIRKSIAAGIA